MLATMISIETGFTAVLDIISPEGALTLASRLFCPSVKRLGLRAVVGADASPPNPPAFLVQQRLL